MTGKIPMLNQPNRLVYANDNLFCESQIRLNEGKKNPLLINKELKS